MRTRLIFSIGCFFLAGCSSELLPVGKVRLTTGQETDTWTREPVPTSAEVVKTFTDGVHTQLAKLQVPAQGFDLDVGDPGSYELIARDAGGTVQVRGRTLFFDPAGLADTVLPLFIQRVEEFARPPQGFSFEPGESPALAILGTQYVMTVLALADGTVRPDLYSIAAWKPRTLPPIKCPDAPCAFKSVIVAQGWQIMGIEDTRIIVDDAYNAQALYTVKLPPGLTSFADIAGGSALTAPDGSTYVIGATRTNAPSDKVLAFTSDGQLKVFTLLAPRAGAAAVWIGGQGLLISGGSATSVGAEFLAQGATAFTALNYPPDPTTGAVLAELPGSKALRTGGHNPDGSAASSIEIALGCGTSCTAVDRGVAVDLDVTDSYAIDADRVLTIGNTSDGETRAVLISGSTLVPVPLKEPRRRAGAVTLPTGQVAIVGGTRISDGAPDKSLELFTSR